MRILYITASLPHGPGEAFVIPEVRELMRQNHAVLVIPTYPRGGFVHRQATDIPACSQPLVSPRILAAAVMELVANPLRVLSSLGLVLTGRPFRILVKNLAVFPKALWLARVLRKWRADHIHCHWAGTSATMAMIGSQLTGVPWSLTAHRWDIVEGNLLRAKMRHSRFTRFISKSGKEMALRRCPGDENHRVLVLHMGVELPREVSEPAEYPVPVILCPANLIPVKGHRYLIEAIHVLQARGITVDLWLAGQGPLRPDLEEQVAQLGLGERVRFLGQLPHAELLQMYRVGRISCVVLPSVDLGDGLHEGIPVSLIEAMSFGIPVVSTRTGGIAELLEDGAGCLVDPGDAVACADAVQRILTDYVVRMELARSGRFRVDSEYDVTRVVKELVTLFQ